MNDFRPWIRPTLIAPFAVLAALTGLAHLSIGLASISGGRLDSWLVAMLMCGFLGAAISVLLIGADLVLLSMRWRRLPTDLAAWLTSGIAPLATLMAWNVIGWGDGQHIPELVLRIVLPMVATAFVVRFVGGSAP